MNYIPKCKIIKLIWKETQEKAWARKRFLRYNAVLCLVAQSCLTLCYCMDCSLPDSLDCSPPGSSVHGDSPGKLEGCHALLQGDLPNQGIKPRSPEVQEDSLPSEPPEKPMNTRVGSLSLLQGKFPTKE